MRQFGIRGMVAITVLAGWVEFAPVAKAASFNFDQFAFTMPQLVFGNSTDVIVPFQTFAPYQFGGEFKQVGDTLAFTNVLIKCSTGEVMEGCGSFDIAFQAVGANTGPGSVSISLSLADATLDAASGFGRVCLEQSTTICSSDATGTDSVTLSFVDGVAMASSPASFVLAGGTSSFVGVFHLDFLPTDATGLQLANSFDIQLKAAFSDVVTPEPGTAILLGFGLVSLVPLRKLIRRGKRAV